MKNLLNAKSFELKSDLLSEQSIKQYRKTFTVKQLYHNFFRSDTSNFTKTLFAAR